MKNQTLKSIAAFSKAELKSNNPDKKIRAISIDSRTIDPGDVYMPIIGERLDGHDFIEAAFEKGASAAFCDIRHLPDPADERDYLIVEDTSRAFSQLAYNYRKSLNLKAIGITGSNGKTTSKDIIYSVVKNKFKSQKTQGNLNNEIGVPRTLLQLDEDCQIAVVEMGMSAAGEMSHLTSLLEPDIAVITNVGPVHLESLKTVENVAKAKLEILESMGSDKTFIYNYDDEILRSEVEKREIPTKIISFGCKEGADVRLELLSSSSVGSRFLLDGHEFSVNLLGEYQMYNAGLAIIIGRLFGLSDTEIQEGLKVEDPSHWRSELVHLKGFDMFLDVYKSNPPSLREALRSSALFQGYSRKIAIIGDMLELGEDEKEIHRQMGAEIDPEVFDYVLFIGPLSRYMMEGAAEHFESRRLFHFANKDDLIDQAKNLIELNTLLLLKASRALQLEEVAESLSIVTLQA